MIGIRVFLYKSSPQAGGIWGANGTHSTPSASTMVVDIPWRLGVEASSSALLTNCEWLNWHWHCCKWCSWEIDGFSIPDSWISFDAIFDKKIWEKTTEWMQLPPNFFHTKQLMQVCLKAWLKLYWSFTSLQWLFLVQYIPLIPLIVLAFWGVICYLPPFRGTRNNHWSSLPQLVAGRWSGRTCGWSADNVRLKRRMWFYVFGPEFEFCRCYPWSSICYDYTVYVYIIHT